MKKGLFPEQLVGAEVIVFSTIKSAGEPVSVQDICELTGEEKGIVLRALAMIAKKHPKTLKQEDDMSQGYPITKYFVI